jgi:hypothetical protein
MNRIIFALVAFGVVGCNVEESDNSMNQDNISNSTLGCTPRSYEELSIYGYGCKETIPSGSSSGVGGDAGGTTTNSSLPASIARYAEYEPNNFPENANPVAFPIVSDDTVPGIEITGAVRDVSDESDYFILSPNQGTSANGHKRTVGNDRIGPRLSNGSPRNAIPVLAHHYDDPLQAKREFCYPEWLKTHFGYRGANNENHSSGCPHDLGYCRLGGLPGERRERQDSSS